MRLGPGSRPNNAQHTRHLLATAVCAFVLTLLPGCWFSHDYTNCETDADCERGRCVEGICQLDEDTGLIDLDQGSIDGSEDIDGDDLADLGLSCHGGQACSHAEECQSGEVCAGRCCIPEGEVGPCESEEQPCLGSAADSEDFLCDTDTGLCRTRCVQSYQTCDEGYFCFAAPRTTESTDGFCIRGDCNDTCSNPNECAIEDAFSCGGGACWPAANGASFCEPGGEVEEGGNCDDEAGCLPGLFCFNGTCEAPCFLGVDGQCAEGEACTAVLSSDTTHGPGLCRAPCYPFSKNECPAGFECQLSIHPLTSESLAWACERVNSEQSELEQESACRLDGSGAGRCAEGLVCAPDPNSAGGGRCQRLCDLTDPQGDGWCPNLELGLPLSEVVGPTDSGQWFAYTEVAAASETPIEAYQAPATPDSFAGRTRPLTFNPGDATTVFLTRRAPSPNSTLDLTATTSRVTGLTGGTRAFEFYNLTGETLDVYVGDTSETLLNEFEMATLVLDATTNWVSVSDESETSSYTYLGFAEPYDESAVSRSGAVHNLFLIGDPQSDTDLRVAVGEHQESVVSSPVFGRLVHG
ncbi:MAG: hypothetical protein KC561_02205, partial [Myxococcales bacterium]|nr:hypothetical protein [Myxococcales bacterium]